VTKTKGQPDPQRIDLNGQRFGRLLVIDYAETKNGRTHWNCLCDCSETSVVSGKDLRSGHTTSCGCRERMKHGFYDHRFYYTYQGMLKRCYDKSHVGYHNYGGRGITVCKEWLDDISKFLRWCESKEPISPGYTLDREYNDKNYTPDNCRFISKAEQQKNSRRYT
jgi:hypothetical protein